MTEKKEVTKKAKEKVAIKENFLLAQRLKERREHLGFFQLDVAKKLGVTSSVISNYEHAYRDPSTHMLKRLATLYGTSVDYLVGMTNIVEPQPIEAPLKYNEEIVNTWFGKDENESKATMQNFSNMLKNYVTEEEVK